eukprot:TRINITY_DN4318_c0_g1_i1.p2 TRINITY_DN4318_c0_g1~~TRINITY_DN4318_c0_g1_i1.p2  ORF type:complete len:165 (-),score=45.02 TRINITY_DN4318_c0_g1_i1:1461-1955(-)
MPVFILTAKCEGNNVKTLYPAEEKNFHIKLECGNCGEVTDKFCAFSSSSETEINGQSFNFAKKCSLCDRQGTISIVGISKPEDVEDEAKILELDCRGMNPVEFQPMDEWIVESEFGTTFEDVSLEDGDWADYDEEGADEVAIYEATFEFKADSGSKGKKGKRRK